MSRVVTLRLSLKGRRWVSPLAGPRGTVATAPPTREPRKAVGLSLPLSYKRHNMESVRGNHIFMLFNSKENSPQLAP